MLVVLTRQDRETAAAFAARRCLDILVNKPTEDCEEFWGGNQRAAAAEMAVSRGLKTLWLGEGHLHHEVDREFFLDVQCVVSSARVVEIFKPVGEVVYVIVAPLSLFEFDLIGWLSGFDIGRMNLKGRGGAVAVPLDVFSSVNTLIGYVRDNANVGREQ